MEHDVLGAHARDELGISDITTAKPLQAAITSAISFSAGAALPLFVVFLTPVSLMFPATAGSAIISLAFLGGLAAKVGGAKILPGVIRITIWSALAMAVTSGIDTLFSISS